MAHLALITQFKLLFLLLQNAFFVNLAQRGMDSNHLLDLVLTILDAAPIKLQVKRGNLLLDDSLGQLKNASIILSVIPDLLSVLVLHT